MLTKLRPGPDRPRKGRMENDRMGGHEALEALSLAYALSEAFWSMVLSGLRMSLLALVLCTCETRCFSALSRPCLNEKLRIPTSTFQVFSFFELRNGTCSPIHWSALGGSSQTSRICLAVGSAGSLRQPVSLEENSKKVQQKRRERP